MQYIPCLLYLLVFLCNFDALHNRNFYRVCIKSSVATKLFLCDPRQWIYRVTLLFKYYFLKWDFRKKLESSIYRNEHPFYLFYSHIINVLLKYSTDYYLNNNGTTNCMKLFSSFHDIIFPIFHFFHKSGFTFITILVMKMQSNCIFSSKYIII